MYNPNFKAATVLVDAMDELDLTHMVKHVNNRIKHIKLRKAEIVGMEINGHEHDLLVAGRMVEAVREFKHRAGPVCSLKMALEKIKAYQAKLETNGKQ